MPAVVGDLAETIALLLPAADAGSDRPLASGSSSVLLPLREAGEERQKAEVLGRLAVDGPPAAFVWNKLITGAFRVGVSQLLVTRALAEVSGVSAEVIAHRLMGDWQPTAEFFTALLSPDAADADVSRPYPFFLAHAARGRRPTPSATSPSGRRSGSGTASARSSSAGPGQTFLVVARRGAGHRPLSRS